VIVTLNHGKEADVREREKKTERITARSLSELMHKVESWKAERLGIRLIREGALSSRRQVNLDDGNFFISIEYEDTQ